MTSKRKAGDFSMFSHTPIQPQWLMRLAAYQSDDAHIVRGAIHMLMSAFHSEQCGTIPNTVEAIAFASHLSVEMVKRHLKELTTGWRVDNRRKILIFEPMAQLVKRLDEKFPEALQDMQERAIMAISSPDLISHELLEHQGQALADQLGERTVALANERIRDTKICRALPDDAQMTVRMCDYLIEKGFTEDMHEDMWEMFYSFHKSRNNTSASWEGEFNVWVMNQIRYGKIVPTEGKIPSAFKATEVATQLPAKVRQAQTPYQSNNKITRGEELENNALHNLTAARQAMDQMRRPTKD